MAHEGRTGKRRARRAARTAGEAARVPPRSIDPLLRQRVRDHVIAELRAERTVAARGEHDVLTAVDGIAHRRGLAARGQTRAPEFLAVVHVARAEVVVR